MNPVNPWTTLKTEVKYDNPWIQVTEHQVLNPAGKPGIYGKVHFKNIAIGIVPLDKGGNIWLVGQYRYTLQAESWEIPEGGGAPGIDPLESASRELKEETGFTANRWTQLLTIHTSNSVTDEIGYIFLAEDLVAGEQELEDTEADLKRLKVTLEKAVEMVSTGAITDSLSIAGILMTARQVEARTR